MHRFDIIYDTGEWVNAIVRIAEELFIYMFFNIVEYEDIVYYEKMYMFAIEKITLEMKSIPLSY